MRGHSTTVSVLFCADEEPMAEDEPGTPEDAVLAPDAADDDVTTTPLLAPDTAEDDVTTPEDDPTTPEDEELPAREEDATCAEELVTWPPEEDELEDVPSVVVGQPAANMAAHKAGKTLEGCMELLNDRTAGVTEFSSWGVRRWWDGRRRPGLPPRGLHPCG